VDFRDAARILKISPSLPTLTKALATSSDNKNNKSSSGGSNSSNGGDSRKQHVSNNISNSSRAAQQLIKSKMYLVSLLLVLLVEVCNGFVGTSRRLSSHYKSSFALEATAPTPKAAIASRSLLISPLLFVQQSASASSEGLSSDDVFQLAVGGVAWLVPYLIFNLIVAPRLGLMEDPKEIEGEGINEKGKEPWM